MHHFSVWAPNQMAVAVEVDGKRYAMRSGERGYWLADVEDANHGSNYSFLLDDDPQTYPDPRSRWQPDGVHAASRVYEHDRFEWSDTDFVPEKLADGVVYELHVGTFTDHGTFAAAEEKLQDLRALGITHVELMPLNSFPGRFGWGYDGVSLYAPQEKYGGPDGLKHFVDACHAHGLAVLLDVVYNHFGPVGNYTGKFGPYLTDSHKTPWGGAVNLEENGSTEVRRFFCDNALMWLRDYHFDGLRLDAIQTYNDRSATHFLEQLTEEVEDLSGGLEKPLLLIAESDLNDPRVCTPRVTADGLPSFGYGLDAQWSDDFHHALFAYLTGQRKTYYVDFGSLEQVAKALRSVFVYDGVYSEHRGRTHGRLVGELNRNHFLGYLQNHDQIGNQAFGDRLYPLVGLRKTMVAAAMVLTSPFIPMLFQGEEFAASTPFLYFAQHDDPIIAQSVSEGRRREHAHEGDAESIPDPEAESSFESSKLNWKERDAGDHARVLEWHRTLIKLRQTTPCLRDGNPDIMRVDFEENGQWLLMRRGAMNLYFNFGDGAKSFTLNEDATLVATSDPENKFGECTLTLLGDSFAAIALRE